jgi:hypothetical protein
LFLNTVVLIDSLRNRVNEAVWLEDINTDANLLLLGRIQQVDDTVLNIETRVGSKSLGDDEEGFSESLDT